MAWEALGTIVALAGVLGTILAVIWRGGRMAERMTTFEKTQDAHTQRLEKHNEELAGGRVRFATMETKLDAILNQQGRILEKVEQLADEKEN